MNITVRGVDVKVFREVKTEAMRRKISLSQAVDSALKLWLKTRKPQRKLVKTRLLDLKPIDFGHGSEKASSQVDEIVYGWKKINY